MAIRTVQLGSLRVKNEGLRIGAVRRLPRGVRKELYAEMDYFDVWLPILAPSRELLSQFTTTGMSFERFARRYRNEMKRTDARQVIQLVAAMAEHESLSIGCYCTEEWRCHRSVLIELIQDAASEPIVEKSPYFPFCIYTIAHTDKLKEANSRKSTNKWRENKRWVAARKLLQEAQANQQHMPILFADATDCSRLLYSGVLDRVKIDGNQTQYTFHSLRRLRSEHSPQELYLRSTDELIAQDFIKPYAICHTPSFLPRPRLP